MVRQDISTGLPVLSWSFVGLGKFVSQVVVFSLETFGLLLQSLNIAVFGCELLLKLSNLAEVASFSNARGVFAGSLLVTLEKLDAIFQTEDFKNHDICTIEDQRKEQCESTEIHVPLRIELASLNLHTLSTQGGGSAIDCSY